VASIPVGTNKGPERQYSEEQWHWTSNK
jgi:hypothetical protein